MHDRTRRTLAKVMLFIFIIGGAAAGIFGCVLCGLLLKGGLELVSRVSQESLEAHFWLVAISGIVCGSLGSVVGAVLGILGLERIKLLTQDEVRKLFATWRM